MLQITAVTTSSVYTDAATLQGVWASPGGYYVVAAGAAYMELQYSPPGQGIGGLQWTNEIPVNVGPGVLTQGTTGVRFRDAGSSTGPAVVTAVLSAEAEPVVIPAGAGIVQVAAGGVIRGIIPATGTTPTSGTGFTYTHANGSGVYVFTLSTAFGTLPDVQATANNLGSGSDGYFPVVSNLSVNGFTVTMAISAGGAGGDTAFSFTAQPS